MSETKDQSNEFSLINRYFKNLTAQQDVVIGIGDDAAILEPTQGHQLALATDSLVCAVHFPEEANAYQIATRSLCVNLSDMAAMGATPKWFTLALTFPKQLATTDWLQNFSQGLADIANQYNVALVGGDTTALVSTATRSRTPLINLNASVGPKVLAKLTPSLIATL